MSQRTTREAPPVNADFVVEGHFVALPLGMPHEALPIRPEESLVAALATSPDGLRIYGSTSGEACHAFVAIHKGAVGLRLDLGIVPGATAIPALAEWTASDGCRMLYLAAETGDGAVLFRTKVFIPGNTIQEPSYPGPCLERVCRLGGRRVHGLCRDAGGLLAVTDAAIVAVDPEGAPTAQAELLARLPHPPAVAAMDDGQGALHWLDAGGGACRFVRNDGLRRWPVAHVPRSVTAACLCRGRLVLAADDGAVSSVQPASGRLRRLGRLPLAPAQCLAALPDGRIYAVCGDGIGHLARIEPGRGAVDLGVIASVIGEIRHGFVFACSLPTPEGVVYLGEHDRGGCLWMYFPAMPQRPAEGRCPSR
jgi:hypothetical protein